MNIRKFDNLLESISKISSVVKNLTTEEVDSGILIGDNKQDITMGTISVKHYNRKVTFINGTVILFIFTVYSLSGERKGGYIDIQPITIKKDNIKIKIEKDYNLTTSNFIKALNELLKK